MSVYLGVIQNQTQSVVKTNHKNQIYKRTAMTKGTNYKRKKQDFFFSSPSRTCCFCFVFCFFDQENDLCSNFLLT